MIDPSPIGDTDKTQPIVQRTYSPRAQNDQNVQNIQKHKKLKDSISHIKSLSSNFKGPFEKAA